MTQLQKKYEAICNEYVQKFCKKEGFDYEGNCWIGGVGGMVNLGDYYFGFSDIVMDVNTKQPKGLIISWHNETIEFNFLFPNEPTINYYSYNKGFRYTDVIPKEKALDLLL